MHRDAGLVITIESIVSSPRFRPSTSSTVSHEKQPPAPSASDSLWASYWKHIQDVGPLTHTRYRLILGEIRSLPPKPRILDVGCGNGTLLKLLRARFKDAELHGVEPSAEACRLAPSDIASAIVCTGIVEFARTEQLNSFDLVVCSEVLEHVDDPAIVLDVAAELLKPEGLAVFTVPAGMKYWSIQDQAAGHLRRFEIEEFRRLLVDCGLQIKDLYTWGGPISSLYNRLVSSVGPRSAASAAQAQSVRALARIATLAMRFDDLFESKTSTRFQLIASATKARTVR